MYGNNGLSGLSGQCGVGDETVDVMDAADRAQVSDFKGRPKDIAGEVLGRLTVLYPIKQQTKHGEFACLNYPDE